MAIQFSLNHCTATPRGIYSTTNPDFKTISLSGAAKIRKAEGGDSSKILILNTSPNYQIWDKSNWKKNSIRYNIACINHQPIYHKTSPPNPNSPLFVGIMLHIVAKINGNNYISEKEFMNSPGNTYPALQNLVSLLTTTEVEQVRIALGAQPNKRKTTSKKMLVLFDTLLDQTEISVHQLAQKLYRTTHSQSVKHLRIRLFAKILTTLLPCDSLDPSAYFLACFQLLDTIWKRGGLICLEAAIPFFFKKAQQCEDFETLLTLVKIRMQLARCQDENVLQYQDLLLSFTNMRDALEQLSALALPIIPDENYALEIEVVNLANSCLHFSSIKIGFICHAILMKHSLQQKDFVSAKNHLDSAQQLMQDDDLDKICPGFLGLQALFWLLNQQPLLALEKCQQWRLADLDPVIRRHYSQLMARIYLENDQAKEANQLLLSICKSLNPDSKQFQFAQFLLARAAFDSNQPKVCLNHLQKVGKKVLDQPTLNISFRLLQIMAMIQNNNFDLAELRLETYRKYLSKFKDIETWHDAYQEMLSHLMFNMRNGFQFQTPCPNFVVSEYASYEITCERKLFLKWWHSMESRQAAHFV